jgi:hypothetical protein
LPYQSPVSVFGNAVVVPVLVELLGNTAPTTPPTVDTAVAILVGLLKILIASVRSPAFVKLLRFL